MPVFRVGLSLPIQPKNYRETCREMTGMTSTYRYAAQSPPTHGQSSLAPLLILTSSSLRNPIGLSVQIARRSARPIGCLSAGLGGDS
jgi:hypothetical protein